MQVKSDMPTLVKAIRARLGLSQEKFAARIGVTFTTINRWEQGYVKPSPLALKVLELTLKDMGEDGRDLLLKYF